jgi:preprotein translocase subunit SecE
MNYSSLREYLGWDKFYERGDHVFERIRKYLMESYGELKKVTWPKKEEVTGSTIVILVFILIMGISLGIVDAVSRVVVLFIIDPEHKLYLPDFF